jgi:hypothetical protein
MTPEGKVKKAIKDFLNCLPNCWWFMPVSTGHGTHGVPDFVVCYKGVFVAIEAKRLGNLKGVTPLQEMQIRRINQSHGFAFATDNVEEVQRVFKGIDLTLERCGWAI